MAPGNRSLMSGCQSDEGSRKPNLDVMATSKWLPETEAWCLATSLWLPETEAWCLATSRMDVCHRLSLYLDTRQRQLPAKATHQWSKRAVCFRRQVRASCICFGRIYRNNVCFGNTHMHSYICFCNPSNQALPAKQLSRKWLKTEKYFRTVTSGIYRPPSQK